MKKPPSPDPKTSQVVDDGPDFILNYDIKDRLADC
jgi:hypothetical protein